ncbi:MAG: hypothetical protein P4L92_19370, partial [Rudaea sp.]|nr:hypothetical protein [Rudaea sp.]
MPWGDRHFTVIAALALAAGSALAHADPPGYGKVDTFEPGKKYSCVPSADHKSWDCTQSGKAATTNSASPPHDEPAAAKPANPQAAASVAPPPAAPASTPAASAPRSSELPSYLKASSASPPAAAPGPIAAPPPVPVPAAARAPA